MALVVSGLITAIGALGQYVVFCSEAVFTNGSHHLFYLPTLLAGLSQLRL